MRTLVTTLIFMGACGGPARPTPPSSQTASRVRLGCPRSSWEVAATPNLLAWADGDGIWRFDRRTGASRDPVPGFSALLDVSVASVALAWNPQGAARRVTAIDLETGTVLWTRPSYTGLTAADAGGEVLVVAYSTEQRTFHLEAFARARASRWARAFAAGEDVRGLVTRGGTIYAVGERDDTALPATLRTFALETGTPGWTAEFPSSNTYVMKPLAVTSDGDVALSLPRAARLVDRTGRVAGEFPFAAAPELIAHDRTIYAHSYDDQARRVTVAAIDGPRRAIKWQVELPSSPSLVLATANRVYLEGAGVLVALDAATGAVVDRRGIGDSGLLITGDGATFGTCTRTQGVKLFDASRPLAVETATVSGALVCKGCRPATGVLGIEQIELHVGDLVQTVSSMGRFTVSVTGSGTLRLFAMFGSHEVRLGTVELTGKGNYDVGPIHYEPWNGNE